MSLKNKNKNKTKQNKKAKKEKKKSSAVQLHATIQQLYSVKFLLICAQKYIYLGDNGS